jgi:iron complex outermembrane receptor protein
VISLFTEEAPAGYFIDGTAQYGTFNTQRYALMTTGGEGMANYVVDAVHFQTEGYRYHSKAERENFNSVLRLTFNDALKLTLVGNAIQTPFVQDPLGLTQAQLDANPVQAGNGAIQYNTRKSLNQEQGGAILDYTLSPEDALSSTVYVGHRATTQFQAIPQSVEEKEPLYPGGVIGLDRAFYGIDSHLSAGGAMSTCRLSAASPTTIWRRRASAISTMWARTRASKARYAATRRITCTTSINTCNLNGIPTCCGA